MRGGIGALDMRRSRAWVLGLDQGGHLIWRLVGSLGLTRGGTLFGGWLKEERG